MAITGNASYVPTMNEFLAHWAQVNAALPAPLIAVREDGSAVTRAQFLTMRQELEQQAGVVIDKLNNQEIERGEIDRLKVALLGAINEFNGLLDAYYRATKFYRARPLTPGITEGQEKFLDPMRDMVSLWGKLNAGTAPAGITLPLVLAEGDAVADIEVVIEALQNAYAAEATAAQDVTLERADRDEMKRLAYTAMKAYREAVPPRCRLFPALVQTLPRLTPEPGHTPEPVNASAVFQAPDQAKVVYEASEEATLASYQLRGNPGPDYREEDAVVIETRTPEDPREFLTGFGLTQPNTRATFKVFVVLESGNEAGSAPMTVLRPAA